jgi:aminoglycoside phosphotransferase (APT) family kinase protein
MELLQRYEQQSGYEFTNRRFYLTLAIFKIAALSELFYSKYITGEVDDEMYRTMGQFVPRQSSVGWDIVKGRWAL